MSTPPHRRALALTVAAVAFAALLLELLLARIFPVVLGDFSSFLAVPATMLGLGLGAVLLHLAPWQPRARWLAWLVPLLLLVDFVCLSAEFRWVDSVFGLTHRMSQNPLEDAVKIAALTTVMVPPFALTGIVLSVAFRSASDAIGRLYAIDLLGSALACFAAPLLLRSVDLPVVCAVQVGALGLASIAATRGPVRWVVAALVLPATVWLVGEADEQRVFDLAPNPDTLARNLTSDEEVVFREVAHRWNDISRVTLLTGTFADGRERTWVVHDDGVSRVNVEPYAPELRARGRRHNTRALPSLLDPPPRTALVIFAGAGRDMLELERFNSPPLDLVGIELNGLVTALVTADSDDPRRLQEYLARPNVQLLADEGRSYLDRSERTWDLIYVANNGAQQMGRTGHSRRFLDTEQALESYLDHLAPGGALVFSRQRVDQKAEMLKRQLADRGVDLADAVAIFGQRKARSLLVKPSGLSAAEVARIEPLWADRSDDWLLYAPHAREPDPQFVALAQRPEDPSVAVPTDDRPYERPLRLAGFRLLPSPDQARDLDYSMAWTKIMTVLLYTTLAGLLVAALLLRRRDGTRLPWRLTAYFLLTGIAYMGVQVGLMAKLELLMGRPLISIAVVLAGFLGFNALGSALTDRRADAGRPWAVSTLAGFAVVAAVAGLLGAEALVRYGLALPLGVKAALGLLVVAPTGVALGTLYPTGVRLTAASGRVAWIPATFALAALSSVLGGTWATVAVINLGFRAVVLAALPLYVAVAMLGLGRRS